MAVDLVVLTDLNVLVGIRCTQGGVTQACLHSIADLERYLHGLGWGLTIETRADDLVTRTIFASQVPLTPDYTHLLMIDSDMGFAQSVIQRLFLSEHGVVGACVSPREVRWNRVRSMLDVVPDLTADETASIAHGHAATFDLTSGSDNPRRPAD